MSKRILAWTYEAWDSYIFWQGQDKKTLKRINKLIKAAKSTPFTGIGKPEPLKENLSGFWSRRIDDTNRLVYAVDDITLDSRYNGGNLRNPLSRYLTIISCRFHY